MLQFTHYKWWTGPVCISGREIEAGSADEANCVIEYQEAVGGDHQGIVENDGRADHYFGVDEIRISAYEFEALQSHG